MTEWQAGEYNRHSRLQQVMAEELLSLLTLRGNERVLDVGCGDGKITAEIAARVPAGSVLGVDPSHRMIEFAASSFGTPAAPNLAFTVADARQLKFRDEFDLVVSFNALHWVHEQAAALGAIRAALKPGGTARLRFVGSGPRKALECVIEDVRRRAPWAGYFPNEREPFAHFTPDEYRAIAERAGLEVVHLDIEDRAWDFQTRDAFLGFARATFVEWTRRLPEEKREPFIVEALDAYQAIAAGTPTERHTFKFYQMNVVLTR